MRKVLVSVLALSILTVYVSAQESKLILSAAASLTDVLTALKGEAEKRIGATLLLNFGGSGTLRKQIEEGAPADLFFSAASEDMDRLEKAGLILPETRKTLLSNALVLVGDDSVAAPKGVEELGTLLDGSSLLAIGNPDSVPAGRYAVQALKALGLYPIVEKKLALAGSVREVLQFVESGSAPLGVVFLTDAMSVKSGSGIGELFLFPEDSIQTPVLYPIAVVAASKSKDKAALLIDFLQGSSARAAFAKAGFVVK